RGCLDRHRRARHHHLAGRRPWLHPHVVPRPHHEPQLPHQPQLPRQPQLPPAVPLPSPAVALPPPAVPLPSPPCVEPPPPPLRLPPPPPLPHRLALPLELRLPLLQPELRCSGRFLLHPDRLALHLPDQEVRQRHRRVQGHLHRRGRRGAVQLTL